MLITYDTKSHKNSEILVMPFADGIVNNRKMLTMLWKTRVIVNDRKMLVRPVAEQSLSLLQENLRV